MSAKDIFLKKEHLNDWKYAFVFPGIAERDAFAFKAIFIIITAKMKKVRKKIEAIMKKTISEMIRVF